MNTGNVINPTERLDNQEDRIAQEADSIKSERMEEGSVRKQSVIPLAIVQWLAVNAVRYAPKPATRLDLTKPTEAVKHPDVLMLQKDYPGIKLVSATRIAWLLWRARQVSYWTSDYATRKPMHSWEACLDAAYLGKDSELHNLAFERRDRYYAAQEEESAELAKLAQTHTQKAQAQANRVKAQRKDEK